MSQKKRSILVVDAEPQTAKILGVFLNAGDFNIEPCANGKDAARLYLSLKPDIVLLDLDLPDMDGYDVIRTLREWSHVPLIVLSARASDADVVKALGHGADDYVTKPFNTNVLEARINANLRKGAVQETGGIELCNGPLRMDLVRHRVFLNDTAMSFTPKEYNLLRYLLVNRGKMLTHKDILQEVWGLAHRNDAQYLRVFIGQIRKKMEICPEAAGMITTEPGIGYRMENFDTAEDDDRQPRILQYPLPLTPDRRSFA